MSHRLHQPLRPIGVRGATGGELALVGGISDLRFDDLKTFVDVILLEKTLHPRSMPDLLLHGVEPAAKTQVGSHFGGWNRRPPRL